MFPTLLFAFAVKHSHGVITFVWPFVFVYMVERVMPFILDEQLNLNAWSKVTKYCAVIAFIGVLAAIIGVFNQIEWLASIGAIAIGIGTTSLHLLANPNEQLEGLNLKKVKLVSGIAVLGCLILLGLIMMKCSITAGLVFYAVFLGLEVVYAYTVVKRPASKFNLRYTFNFKRAFLVLAVLVILLIISLFKKTGHISDISWLLIILAFLGIVLEGWTVLGEPFLLFRVWLGAIKNYIIIYTLLFAFQQNRAVWIFIVFIELMVGGMLSAIVAKKMAKMTSANRYRVMLGVLVAGLLLTYTDWTYLLGTALVAFSAILIGKWVKQQAPDKHQGIDEQLSVFGSLCNQIVLFGAVELISLHKFDNVNALLLPYIDHHQAPQYSREMFYLRVSMVGLLLIVGAIMIWRERKGLFNTSK